MGDAVEHTPIPRWWDEAWERFRRLDPRYFEAYARLARVPWETSSSLRPRDLHLICVALHASATTLYEGGARAHVRAALAEGADREEVVAVLQLATGVGMHPVTEGVPMLLDVLGERGESPTEELSPRAREVKAEFLRVRGYWSEFWEALVRLSPEYLAAYVEVSGVPWADGALEPRLMELVYVAINAACTCLWKPGMRIHMKGALDHGATAAEVMQVLQLATVLGANAQREGLRLLEDSTDEG